MLEGDNKNIKLEEQKACQERGNSTLGRQDALRGGVASPKDTIPQQPTLHGLGPPVFIFDI